MEYKIIKSIGRYRVGKTAGFIYDETIERYVDERMKFPETFTKEEFDEHFTPLHMKATV